MASCMIRGVSSDRAVQCAVFLGKTLHSHGASLPSSV